MQHRPLDVMPTLLRSIPISIALSTLCLAPARASAQADGAEKKGKEESSGDRPHIVLILTDNHGEWTLGCYGNEDIRTPNLDRFAKEGALFSRAFAINPVCSPTRASILTGLMPSQHGVMTPTDPKFQMGPQARNMLAGFTTLPEILRDAGYRCGLSGKWHLGGNRHPQEGLDDLWVTMPRGSTRTFYGAEVIEDGKVRREPHYLTDLWTDRAVEFIEESAKKEEPMFLYLAYNGPYGLGRPMGRSARNRHAEYYATKSLHSFPRVPTRPWQIPTRDFVNNLGSFRRYAAEVSGVDDGVGRVLEALRRTGMEKDTLVIFTGDQGLGCGQNDLWGMGDHTRPLHAFDSTMQVPLLMRQPGVIPEGKRIERLVSQVDLFPTVLHLAELEGRMPEADPRPGQDLSGVLTGKEGANGAEATNGAKKTKEKPKKGETETSRAKGKGEGKMAAADGEAIFFEFENTRAIRTGDWKLIERFDDGGKLSAMLAHDELYHLASDPGETNNLYEDPDHERVRKGLRKRLREFFDRHRRPGYDMWEGGDSQTHNIVMGEKAAARHRRLVEERHRAENPFDPDFVPPPMDMPDGVAVETVAAPPLVNHPVATCLDDRGRLFVCENTGDNLDDEELAERKQNEVRVLTDGNGDGIYEEAQTFADGFTFPQGVLWHDGALYVASPPAIWKLVDTDDDGRADERTRIASGFGYNGNAASVHTPRLSPTGRLFWGHGRKPSKIENVNGKVVHEGNSARIWTALPDGSDLDWFSGGGMANPVELDFWKTGEPIGDVNVMLRNPSRSDTLVHWQYKGVYPKYSHAESLSEFTRTGDLLRPFYDFGHVAVAGLTRYRSGALAPAGEDWTDQYFLTLFNNQELLRLDVERDGATFRASTHPFLKIRDPDVHLVGVIEDADGSLLLTDTGGWFREGCPASGVAKPDIPGAIYRIRPAGEVDHDIDHRGTSIDWKNASPAHLATLLGDSRHAVRRRAATVLAGRGGSAVDAVAGVLSTHPDPDVRISAAFALGRIGREVGRARGPLRTALRDPDPEVRLAATRAVAEIGDPASWRRLMGNLHHEFPALRRQSAVALGRIGHPRVVPDLIAALARPGMSRPVEHALIRALVDIDDPKATRKALTDLDPHYEDDPDYLRRRLVVLDRIDPEGLAADEVVPHLLHADEALRETAIDLFSERPAWAGKAAGLLRDFRGEPKWDQLEAVEAILATGAKDGPAIRTEITAYLESDRKRLHRAALGAIGDAPGLEADPAWLSPLRALFEKGDEDEITAALAAARAFDPQPFEKEARELARDESRPDLLRVRALQLAGGGSKFIEPAAFDLVASMLEDSETPPGERIRACHILAESRLKAPQVLRVAKLMADAGPLEFPILFRGIRPRRNDLEIGKFLARAYIEAPGANAVPAREIRRLLTTFYPPEVWRKPLAKLEKRLEREANQKKRLARLEAAVLDGEGDVDRGKKVAHAATSTCVTCHRIGEAGNHVGPDLSRIGRIRKTRDLLESILLPSATIAQDYEGKTLTTTDGQMLTGVIRSGKPDAVEIGLATGQSRTVPRSKIESLEPMAVSLMPMGLGQILPDEKLVDLVAYLRTLK